MTFEGKLDLAKRLAAVLFHQLDCELLHFEFWSYRGLVPFSPC
jgi:hypothetical protein